MQDATLEIEVLVGALEPTAHDWTLQALPGLRSRIGEALLVHWVKGAKRLLEADVAHVPLLGYLRSTPSILEAHGPEALARIVAVGLGIARHADPHALAAFFESLQTATSKLRSRDALLAYLDLLEELTPAKPAALAPFFEQVGTLLERFDPDGLRRWVWLGVQAQAPDPAAQVAWFKLEHEDARAILLAAQDGTLFTDIEHRLTLYVRGLWGLGSPLRSLKAPEHTKRGKRVSIVDGSIRMPASFEAFPGQSGATVYRAAAAHAAAHLVFSTEKFPLRALRPVQIALASLFEDARVEALAMSEMPGLRRLWVPFHIATPGFAASAESLMARLARALIDERYEDDNPFVIKGRRMFTEVGGDRRKATTSRELGNLLGNDLGQMRVQFNFKTYLVEPLYRDDNLWLWDYGDADASPSEDRDVFFQPTDFVPREGESPLDVAGDATADGSEPERGMVEVLAKPVEQSAIEEALSTAYRYDEWDYAIEMSRPGWCSVFEKTPPTGDAALVDRILDRHAATVNRLAAVIKAVQVQRRRREKRHLEGDRLDMEACIAAAVDLRAGRAPDPRVHQRDDRSARDVSALLLLDLSQSTNNPVPGTDTTILGLAREASALVAHAMTKLGDDFAIHGFNSNGRQQIDYYRLKDFGEDYDETSRARIAAMTGQLSTRMGPALRHAARFHRHRRAHHKLVIVLTDGAPHDIDVHDRHYLLFDAKRAVEEHRREGIATFCISLDPGADEYVARIFGARNYIVLDRLARLPEKLPALYLRLTG